MKMRGIERLSLDQADRDYLAQCIALPGDDGPTLRALRKPITVSCLGSFSTCAGLGVSHWKLQ